MLVKAVLNDSIADKLLLKVKAIYNTVVSIYEAVRGFRVTSSKELMVHQVNQPGLVGTGVNRRNKDGTLILGDDGQYLRNVRVRADGTLVVSHDQPIEVIPHLTEVHGAVTVKDTVTVRPVMVSNMPTEIRVQEGLNVSIIPMQVEVLPFSFSGGLEVVLIPGPCRVYSLYLAVCDSAEFEIPGIVGNITTKEFKWDIYPSSIKLDKLVINWLAHCKCGGYAVVQPITGMINELPEEVAEEQSIKDMMRRMNDIKNTASEHL